MIARLQLLVVAIVCIFQVQDKYYVAYREYYGASKSFPGPARPSPQVCTTIAEFKASQSVRSNDNADLCNKFVHTGNHSTG